VAGALQDGDAPSCWGRRASARAPCRPSSRSPDGSGLRLTTAKYFTQGRSIHGKGITPAHRRRDAQAAAGEQAPPPANRRAARLQISSRRSPAAARAIDLLKAMKIMDKTTRPAG